MKKRLLAAVLAGTMVIGMITGCSTPGSKDSEESSEKVFRYSSSTEPTTLDSSKCNSIPDNEIQHAITESLVRNTGGDVQPGLAEDWKISPDGLTYTFYLRDGIKWSDGEPITANDFVYSWQRLLDPETASVYAFIGEHIKNGALVETGELPKEELGVSAPDDQTFVVELENPTAYFLSMIGAQAQFAPLRQDIVEKYGAEFAADAEKNVYSGPYVLTDSSNRTYIFEPNENYWNRDAIKLDRVVLSTVENTDTALSMYEDGDLDYVEIPSAYVSQYEGQDQTFMNGNVDYLYINCAADYVSNQNFRLALNYGINRNDYMKLAVDDVYVPYASLVFSGLKTPNATYGEDYDVDVYPLDGDMDKAKEYLNKAMEEMGIASPSDITIEFTTTDAEANKVIAEVVQDQWTKNLGINVEIRQVTYSEIYGNVYPEGDFQVGYAGWGADYDDAYSYLEIWKSDNTMYKLNYKNDEFDSLLVASKTETDEQARMDMLNKAEMILLEEGAFVPLQTRSVHYLLNDKVKDLTFFHCSINRDWVYADIETE